jgi:hypothetical protein
VKRVFQLSPLRMLICPDAGGAQNRMAPFRPDRQARPAGDGLNRLSIIVLQLRTWAMATAPARTDIDESQQEFSLAMARAAPETTTVRHASYTAMLPSPPVARPLAAVALYRCKTIELRALCYIGKQVILDGRECIVHNLNETHCGKHHA